MSVRAVLLVGHADPDSFNFRLAAAFERGFTSAGGSVTRFNLADLQFDPVLRRGFAAKQDLEPDLLAVKAAIDDSQHLVWVFPTYWAAPPTVVRGLFDRLFLPGWAFRYEKGKALPLGLLRGKRARVITTMDSPSVWYSLYYGRCLHRSFGTASLKFCGLSPVNFTMIYNMLHMPSEKRERWLLAVESLAREDALQLAAKSKGQLKGPGTDG
jgi:NAD(P)H dehydrogenase (quinone)